MAELEVVEQPFFGKETLAKEKLNSFSPTFFFLRTRLGKILQMRVRSALSLRKALAESSKFPPWDLLIFFRYLFEKLKITRGGKK